MISSNYHSL